MKIFFFVISAVFFNLFSHQVFAAGGALLYKLASDSTGDKLAIQTVTEYIYTSTDSATTLVKQINSGTHAWRDITSDSTGTNLAAAATGYIYTSTDSGATWTEQTSSGSHSWYGITSDSTGSKLAATVIGGYIYTSTDSGATWTEQTSSGSRSWDHITSDSTGSKLAAIVNNGYIYTSTDSGATWTEQTSSGSRFWTDITSDSSGNNLAAVANGFYVYTSADSGITWTEQTNSNNNCNWTFITSNSAGNKLAGICGSYIYKSNDSGFSWTKLINSGSHTWYSPKLNSTGNKLAAIIYGSPVASNIYSLIITLSDISITTPATKLSYHVGESLDISGLVVTGTYSDTTTQNESITSENVTGFNSAALATDQVLTVTVGGKTTTYTVNIVPVTFELKYFSGNIGTIEGAVTQTVNQGSDGMLVTAVANDGYRFYKWSDDVTTVTRTDLNVQENINVSAQFISNPNSYSSSGSISRTPFTLTTSLTLPSLGCGQRITGFNIVTGKPCGENEQNNLKTTTPNNSDLNSTNNLKTTSYNLGTTILKNGSKGEEVKELQKFLYNTLKLGLAIDGNLGPKTISAVKQWQKDNGLAPDGLVGPETKKKINTEVSKINNVSLVR